MIPSPICFRGNLKPRTGYGTIPENLARVIASRGHRVTFDDYGCGRHSHRYTEFVATHLHGDAPAPCAIHCAPPDVAFDNTEPTICLTMWETTGLPVSAVPILNRAHAVAVPSSWGAACFARAGVRVPIHVVPLGLDPAAFRPTPTDMDGPTVFGMAARLVAGGCRKGINEGMAAFAAAFPDPADPVQLRIRIWDDDLPYLDPLPDHRIRVETDAVPQDDLAGWYAGLTCLLVPSKGEGFGMHTLEAMACGRPVIAARYGGTAEFFDGRHGWDVPYDLEPAGGLYEGCGQWAVPRHHAMVRAMRMAHQDRETARVKGHAAAIEASRWTWDRAATALLGLIDATFAKAAA